MGRIGEFNSKMDQRSTEIVGRYRTALEKIVARRVEFVKSVFDKLYADKDKHADHETAMANYSAELAAEVNALVSEPALQPKRPAASITKATSMKSEPRLPDTSLHSTPRSVNGTNKSQIGNQLPKPVLKKRSPVCFHGATAEPNQLKPKS